MSPQGPAAPPPKPERPQDGDCCRGDCALCVFDLYERELERWEAACADWQQQNPSRETRSAE